MPSFPKPMKRSKSLYRMKQEPDWEWDSYKQSVVYPWLWMIHSLCPTDTYLFRTTVPCFRCSKELVLTRNTRPNMAGKYWEANFDLHHIAPRGSYPELKFVFANIVAVCRSCHMMNPPESVNTNSYSSDPDPYKGDNP
jgi:hypothetical protein